MMRHFISSVKRTSLLLVMLALAIGVVGSSARAQVSTGTNPAYGAAAGAPANSIYVNSTGKVGLSSNSPRAKLDVVDPINDTVARFGVLNGLDARFGLASNGLATISFLSQDGKLSGTGTEDGKQAIAFDRVNGILSLRTFNQNRLSIDQFGKVGIGTSTPSSMLDVAGTTRTNVLVIDAGGDLAEPFDINGVETIESGMVVAIDPDNPGQLRLSTAAYDRTVAGVVSGAGGINPGLILQQEGSVAAGEHPVALSGRVYVYADATNGAIEPGDLLTTSATPGHAMKVTDHDRAQGAVLGKAMSRLEEGTGLVLVLVTLQ